MLCDWPFLFMHCADLAALWPFATCRDEMLVESLFKECGVKPPQTKAATSRRTPNMSMNPTIMKFGGTSVEDANAFRNVAGIVKDAVPLQPVVVVSAIGGFTNALLASVEKAIGGDGRAATRSLDHDLKRHVAIGRELLNAESRAAFELTVA